MMMMAAAASLLGLLSLCLGSGAAPQGAPEPLPPFRVEYHELAFLPGAEENASSPLTMTVTWSGGSPRHPIYTIEGAVPPFATGLCVAGPLRSPLSSLLEDGFAASYPERHGFAWQQESDQKRSRFRGCWILRDFVKVRRWAARGTEDVIEYRKQLIDTTSQGGKSWKRGDPKLSVKLRVRGLMGALLPLEAQRVFRQEDADVLSNYLLGTHSKFHDIDGDFVNQVVREAFADRPASVQARVAKYWKLYMSSAAVKPHAEEL